MRFSPATLTALFVLLSVLDAVLTMIGLADGKSEMNPLARALMARIGVLPAVLLIKLASVAAVLAIARRVRWLLPVACVATAAVVLWNLGRLIA